MARAMMFTAQQTADIARGCIESALRVLLDCFDDLPEHVTARAAVAAIRSDGGEAEFAAKLVAAYDQWAARCDGGEFL